MATLSRLGPSALPDVAGFDTVVVGASIRYGKHRPEVADFMRRNRTRLERGRCAFFSVNVVARKPGKDTPDGNPYVKEFLREIGWRPALLGVFAGKLDDPRYGFTDRNVIRLIMLLTDGPTDPKACVDFTHWPGVDAFARRVATLGATVPA
ncbi:MAG: menaquinone-dependent protoporphyrinogen IX dehydrogenase [Nevskiaceae bacterium]